MLRGSQGRAMETVWLVTAHSRVTVARAEGCGRILALFWYTLMGEELFCPGRSVYFGTC